MLKLPIGISNFGKLRKNNYCYVDKTDLLLMLINNGAWYFLARPRRFGKSLTISTLQAMFQGKAELFKGLAAENFVKEQAKLPSPVVYLDMSSLGTFSTKKELEEKLKFLIQFKAEDLDLTIPSLQADSSIQILLRKLFKTQGEVVLLIDEYDVPIVRNLDKNGLLEEYHEVMHDFYSVIKSCDEFLRFVFITGISKFAKMSVFSAMNNLIDISMHDSYGAILGYTQDELEKYFEPLILEAAKKRNLTHEELIFKLKEYYDGYSFDGVHKVYNPWSILNFLDVQQFNAFWSDTGYSSFLFNLLKKKKIIDLDYFHGIKVKKSFTSAQEIGKTDPASFLYQCGYLTIISQNDSTLTLDYPNKEILNSISQDFLEEVYKVLEYPTLAEKLCRALIAGEIAELVNIYNITISGIPYDDFPHRNEYWYRSIFIALLRCADILTFAEVHTFKGRADICIKQNNHIYVFEFKIATKSNEIKKVYMEGLKQIHENNYAKTYNSENFILTTEVLVIDDEKRIMIDPKNL